MHRFIIHYLKRINRNISNKTLTKSNASNDINKLFDSKVSAVEKIDGSNFGIDSDGRLFGRRTELGFSFKTFKGCDVEKLRDFDVIGIHKELSTYLNPANMNFDNNDNTLKNVRLYGELSCYPELYKYKKRGLDCKWHCFGILLNVSGKASEWVKILVSKGFAVSHNKNIILLLSNKKLYKLLDKYSIPHLKIKYQGTLRNLIINKEKWMKKHSGEGFVVTLTHDKDTIPTSSLIKWKQSQEEQFSGIKELKQLLSLYNKNNNKNSNKNGNKNNNIDNKFKKSLLNIKDLLTPELINLFRILLDVASNKVDSSNSQNIISNDLINKAIKSAETKYDNLESFINKSSKKKKSTLDVVKTYGKLIKKEVLKDIKNINNKQKKNYIEKAIIEYTFRKVIELVNKKLKKSNKTSDSKHIQLLIDETIHFLNINDKNSTSLKLIKEQAKSFINLK